MTTRITKPFWQIEMAAENYLQLHQCYNEPNRGIDFIIESCKIDLIPLKNVTNEKLMGFFGNNGREKFIAYNAKLIPERILFTKAHELGHFILEHNLKNDIVKESSEKSKDPQETEANVFAAALLMPKALVINTVNGCLDITRSPVCKENNLSYDDLTEQEKQQVIQAMKERFHTSKMSINFRLKNLSKS